MKKIFLLALMATALFLLSCAPADTTEPEPGNDNETLTVTLYFGCPEALETGEPGEYGFVTPVSREIPRTQEVLRATLEELIRGPTPEDGDLHTVIPSSVSILSIRIEDAVAIIDLSDDALGEEWRGGTLGGTVFVQSIVRTATQFPTVDKVQVLVDGAPWDDGHWVWDQPQWAEDDVLPPEIQKWVDYSRDLWLAQTRQFGENLYLLVTYGEKPSGGYSVEITDVMEEDQHLTVAVEFTKPAEGEQVTDAITRPYDLKKIDPIDMPVEFVAEGAENYVPILHGIDYLPPIQAASERIQVFAPAPGSVVPRKIDLKGIELVFEGTVLYRLMAGDQELESGLAPGGHGYNWGYFETEIEVPERISSGESLLLEVYSESAKDGSVEYLVEIELTLE